MGPLPEGPRRPRRRRGRRRGGRPRPAPGTGARSHRRVLADGVPGG
nr:MAG TPA: hypothetical protein [Caudoviricetes sp.]